MKLPPRKSSSERSIEGTKPRGQRPRHAGRERRRPAHLAVAKQLLEGVEVPGQAARGQCHGLIDLAKHQFRCKGRVDQVFGSTARGAKRAKFLIFF